MVTGLHFMPRRFHYFTKLTKNFGNQTGIAVPDYVTFLNQVTYSGNLVQTELPIERKPNQITFGWTVLPSHDSSIFPQMQIARGDVFFIWS